ncbi:Bax inhibitor-1/YccA family protein [Moheibacter stercoris]|uniref:FtsH-binding integral membrane protein n=1 Tax=Moheibacter stercoris TaxID=1628251 RepID=A0ABV2LS11_9FLAO
MEYNNNPILVANATEVEKAEFYKKTYMHVALGVLIFIILETILLRIDPLVNLMLSLQGYSWLILLAGFMGVTYVAQNMANNTFDKSKQYMGYFLFILAEAIIFIPILYLAMYYGGGPKMIMQAGIITAGMFLGLTAAVMMTKVNFSILKTGLTIGFFIALGLIAAGVIFGFNLGLWFSVGMVVLASGSILYSTHQIKNEYSTNQYVPAALSLFASLMLLFWYILQIFMSRD